RAHLRKRWAELRPHLGSMLSSRLQVGLGCSLRSSSRRSPLSQAAPPIPEAPIEPPSAFVPRLEPLGGPLGLLARAQPFEALRFREFGLLWIGQLGSTLGQQMDTVTRGWLIYDLTGSALQLGLINLLRLFPFLFLAPLAGTAADRYGRKTQLIVDQTTNAL